MNRCLSVCYSGPTASHSVPGSGGLTSLEVLEGNRCVYVCATTGTVHENLYKRIICSFASLCSTNLQRCFLSDTLTLYLYTSCVCTVESLHVFVGSFVTG